MGVIPEQHKAHLREFFEKNMRYGVNIILFTCEIECEMTPLEPGNTGVVLLADDFQKTVDELKNKGVEFTQEPKKEPWGTYAMFKDPDGNEFWLMPRSDLRFD